ncbi:uncharacterized protein [Nicotiana tomentosiformis]|uniref:uncharacterized protein n=1 Tax=Nicotiana tomentosiformis TaxID=4098 RepID=UPI00388CDBCF
MSLGVQLVILMLASIEEKIGGIPYQINKSIEFLNMIEDCGFTDLGFYGPRYIWSNGWDPCAIVWKRLDRGLVNDNWLASFPATTITHLASSGSDHSPFLMDMNINDETFMPLVQAIWNKPVQGNSMCIFHQKTKNICSALSKWSRQEYGDIFQKVKEFENKVRTAEETWAHTNLEYDRIKLHELNAQYIRHMKIEESVLKQKTQLQWFKEGDANSIYFHNLIRCRRRKLYIHKSKTSEDEWVQGDEAIGEAACDHFQNLFTNPGGAIREDLLSCIPTLVTREDNEILTQDPTIQEIKDVVFSMNPTSADGPGGLNGKCFQHCWDIIKTDLLNVVNALFCGATMPRHMTQTCIVLLPKVEFPNSFSEFRPIPTSSTKLSQKLSAQDLYQYCPELSLQIKLGLLREEASLKILESMW